MAVRNPTTWTPPSGKGYITSASGTITTQASVNLTEQDGTTTLTLQPQTYQPEFAVAWTPSTKSKTPWELGNIITVGAELFITNLGSFLTTNSGNNLVTTPTYATPKSATQWSLSGV